MRLNFIVFENLDFPTILEIAIVGSRAVLRFPIILFGCERKGLCEVCGCWVSLMRCTGVWDSHRNLSTIPYQNALDDMSRSITVEQIARIAKPIVIRRHVAELYMFGSMLRGEVYVN